MATSETVIAYAETRINGKIVTCGIETFFRKDLRHYSPRRWIIRNGNIVTIIFKPNM